MLKWYKLIPTGLEQLDDAIAELVSNAKRVFDQDGTKLNKDRRLFSKQLFDGYQSIYGTYCRHQYLASEKGKDKKFKDAIMLFFF